MYNSTKLIGCLNAIIHESQGVFFASYGIQATFQFFPPSGISNASFWDGSGIPLFIETSNLGLGFHSLNKPGAFGGTKIVPLSNFPYAYPWMYVSYTSATNVAATNAAAKNQYSFSNADDFICPVISHEIFETLGDSDINHYHHFGNDASPMQHVYFAKKLSNGAYDPSGYTIDSNGTAHFPSLLIVFPSFFAFVIEEAGDPVSRGSSEKFNSFLVNGYRVSNYPTKQSFNCYDSTPQIYDRMGHMQYPCIPYGGLHEAIVFTDKTKGITYSAQMDNFGPLNGTQINKIYGTHYPPFPANTPFLTLNSIMTGSSPDSKPFSKHMKSI